MKNWMKRIVSAAVVVSMSVALLAGCGKSQTSSTTAEGAIVQAEKAYTLLQKILTHKAGSDNNSTLSRGLMSLRYFLQRIFGK